MSMFSLTIARPFWLISVTALLLSVAQPSGASRRADAIAQPTDAATVRMFRELRDNKIPLPNRANSRIAPTGIPLVGAIRSFALRSVDTLSSRKSLSEAEPEPLILTIADRPAIIADQATATQAAQKLLRQGIEQYDQGNYEAAFQAYQQALTLYRQNQDRRGEAGALMEIGSAYFSLGSYDKSLESLQQALAIARELKDQSLESIILVNLGPIYYVRGEYAQALTLYQQSLTLARSLKDRLLEGKILGNMGNTYAAQEEYTKAIDLYQQRLAIAEEVKDQRGMGLALTNMGVTYKALGEYQRALEAYQKGLAIARQLNNPYGETAALLNLGNIYRAQGNYPQALTYQQQSLAIAQRTRSRPDEATIRLNLGTTHLAQQAYPEALALYQQSLAIARELKDYRSFSTALQAIASLHQHQGKLDQAIEWQQQVLALAQQVKDQRGTGTALSRLSDLYLQRTDYRKAIEAGQQSLAIARQSQDHKGEVAGLNALGSAYFVQGDYSQAVKLLEQALGLAREKGDHVGEGRSLNNLGIAYRLQGKYPLALATLEQALTLARSRQSRDLEDNSLGNLGTVYMLLGNYGKAISVYEQSLAIARRIGSKLSEHTDLGNLGVVYLQVGNPKRGEAYLQQQLNIARAIGDRNGEGRALGNLGIAFADQDNYPQAIAYYEKFLAIARDIGDRRGMGNALGNLGLMYEKLGNYPKAREYQQQRLAIAKAMPDPQAEAETLNNLGQIYDSEGNAAAAIVAYRQSLKLSQQIQNRLIEGIGLNNLGGSLFETGDLPLAAKTLQQAIQVWESLRADLGKDDASKVSIFEQQALTYRALQMVLIAQNKPAAALEIAERGRARAFVELLQSKLGDRQQNNQPILAAPNIQQIQQIAQQQRATLVSYSLLYGEVRRNRQSVNAVTELLIWVVQPTGQIHLRRVPLNPLFAQNLTLEDLVSDSREAIGVRSRGLGLVASSGSQRSGEQRLRQLHQFLIEPIAPLLPSQPSDRVIFIPQGVLFLVPFAALQNAQGKYLLEQHTVSLSPSIQVLAFTHQKRHFGRKHPSDPSASTPSATRFLTPALIVGNPTMPTVTVEVGQPPEQLASLPGAEAEAKAIAQLLGTQALLGDSATKARVMQQMQTARLIHLATHGLMDDFKGLGVPGAIALAPNQTSGTEPDNGLLTASEIIDLKLQADLVVLSACDTGRGRITGDGVIGLSRSLIAAGAPSIIVSLWAVPDAPTATLMTQFYQSLQANPDKAQALRQAMLNTRQQHPDPRDWAAFTLIGEAE